MEQKLNTSLHNRFDIEVTDSKTGELKNQAYAENIILNQAWAQILQTGNWFSNIHVGTGTGTIDAARTTMFTQLIARAATDPVWNKNKAENWYSLRLKIVLTETEYVGSVMTEVGIGTSGGVLCTHALLKDMNGNQVSITKTNVDIITIYATTYLKIPSYVKDAACRFANYPAGQNSLICAILGRYIVGQIGNTADQYTVGFPNRLDIYSAACERPVTVEISGVTPTATADVANKRISYYYRVPADTGNIGGIKGYSLYGFAANSVWYRKGYPVIESIISAASLTQATVVEQIGTGDGVTTMFATAFPFVQTGAVIKVDGAVVSPTVITGAPKIKDIKGYMYNWGSDGSGENDGGTQLFPSGTNAVATIFENPFYASYGIDSIVCSNCKLSTSSDMVTWTQVYSGTGTYTVVTEQRQKQYWKAEMAATTAWNITAINCNAFDTLKNVQFSTAPATGAVITAEYNTDVAAKDINHVLDITVTIQLGEYIP